MRAQFSGALVLTAIVSASAMACGSGEPDSTTAVEAAGGTDSNPGDGDGEPGTGDADGESETGDGDGDAGTGDGDGDAGDGDGDGDPDTGGDGGFSCPEGLVGQTPSLDGVTLQLVATPPDDGFPEQGAFELLEGPVWIDGTLYLSHIAGGGPPPKSRILALVEGNLQAFWPEAGTNGLGVDALGRMLLGRHSDGTISRVELSDLDTVTPLVSSYEGQRFNSPNDLVLSSAGHLYFSDPNWQAPDPNPQQVERAYYLLEGSSEAVAFASEVTKPNGVMLSLDEMTLYVGGTGGLYSYSVAGEGSIAGEGTVVPAVNGGVDGMGKDCAGNLYVTASGQVVVLTPANEVVGSLALEGVTNVAFGGPERRTLYATTLQEPGLYAAELSIPGFAY